MTGYTPEEKARTAKIEEGVRHARTDGIPEDSVLVKWVVVCDWLTPDGERQLCQWAPEHTAVWDDEALLAAALRAGAREES